MPRTIYFEGRTIQVPDDFSDEEIRGILSQGAPPMQAAPRQAARASLGDPRFFAPASSVASGTRSPVNTVDPRFLTTMDTPVAGEATDSGNVGQSPSASTLGMSLFYATQQDSGQYARLLHLQDLTGIPPIISAGHEAEIQQWVDANRIDPQTFTTIAPNAAVWASDFDNAAVSGVDEILRLGRIEQNAAAMRAAPSLNTFLNRYGSAAIPTSADDPRVQAWKRVASFWGPLGNGLVDPLVAAANQALARQHAGDSAYRATPRPEPATIAEEAQQATTPRALQVYTPAAPTVAPLPTPAETAAPIVRYPADAMAAVTYTNGKPDDPALLADIQKQQTADRDVEQNRRDAETAATWEWLNRPINLGYLRENIAANEALVNAGPTMADVESQERSIKAPWYHPQLDMARVHELETFVRSFSTNAAKMFLTPFGIATAVAGPVGEAGGEAIPAIAPTIRLLEGAAGVGFGVKGVYDQAHQGLTKQPGESWADYVTRTSGNAAMVLGGLTGGSHAVSGAIDDLGFERAASEGLGEGAREAMGENSTTEPLAGPVFGTDTFFGNLSQAMAEAADSKLRGRAPGRFYQALQAIFQGNDSLQIPVEEFNDYFIGKSTDPTAVAREIGAENYPDAAATPGAKVEVPTEGFLGKLTSEDQRGLLPDVVDPAIGMTLSEQQALQRWLAKPPDAPAQASTQMVATPEGQMATESSPKPDADSGTGAADTPAANTPDTPVQTAPERQTATEAAPQGEGIRTNVKKKTKKVAGGLATIGGRKPINSRYAGGMHPEGIRFSEQGFPDFGPHAIAQVRVRGLTGRNFKDFAMANDTLGIPSTPKGYTWHHVEDGKTMQLIPSGIHRKVRHTGGAAVIRNGGLDKK